MPANIRTPQDDEDQGEIYMPLSGSRIRKAQNRSDVVSAVQKVVDWSKQFPQPEQKSVEWQNQRAYYCTASQHASALGRCKYKSRTECLRQYAGVVRSTFTGNVATRHGEKYEDEAVAKYCKLRGVDVLHFGMLPFYEQATWLGGSPDGISVDGYLIEVKCPYKRKPNGSVPSHYMPQIQSMMHGLELHACHFIEYVPGTEWSEEIFDVIEVKRDENYWTEALPLLRLFWDEVSVLRETVTEDLMVPEQDEGGKGDVAAKPRTRPRPPAECNIVYKKPRKNRHGHGAEHRRLFTADSLELPFFAQFCTEGLPRGGQAQ